MVYQLPGCKGPALTVGAEHAEDRCKGCIDACKAAFDDGSPAHSGRSRMTSFAVHGPGAVRGYTGCHGSWPYDNPENSFIDSAIEADGCVTPETTPDHFRIYPTREAHDREHPVEIKLVRGDLPAGLRDVHWPGASLPPNNVLPGKPGSLRCDAADGSLAVFWRDIPDDSARFAEPPFPQGGYLSFDPDQGGWNNVRLGVEIAVLLAAATGRTLVLPPDKKVYLLSNEQRRTHNPVTSFYDLSVITGPTGLRRAVTAEQFLATEVRAAGGRFADRAPLELGRATRGREVGDARAWSLWLRAAADWTMNWTGEDNIVVFPESNAAPPLAEGRPGLDAVAKVAGARAAADGRLLAQHQWVHMPVEGFTRQRYLSQFYSWLYFMNSTHDRRYRRMARDVLRYKPRIMCKAASIIGRLREAAGGEYYSAHVRRGEFQQKPAWLSADELHRSTRDLFPRGAVLYVSTDERNKGWFAPWAERYRLRFYTDFQKTLPELADVEPGEVGMIEQVVASAGAVFVGTWWSTFTAYIMRMRGYRGMGKKSYFTMPVFKHAMQLGRFEERPKTPGWWREWPVAWNGIDYP